MNWLLQKAGLAQATPAEAPGVPAAGPSKDNGPPACEYPEDVPWSTSPCLTCDNPCAHKQMPDYLKIDMEEPLLGSMKPYKRHVLFQTPGQTPRNWAPKLEEVEGSLGQQLAAAGTAAGLALGCRIIVTAVDDDAGQQAAAESPLLSEGEVLVLPDMVVIGPISADNARSVLEGYLTKGEVPEGVSTRSVGPWRPPPGADPASGDGGDAGVPCAWVACVLVCAHKLRDKRCGVAAPLIMEELRAECAKAGLAEQVAVMGCSHVGGHKFAGNLIVYSSGGGHWYGRVKPCHAEAVVGTHISQGQVIKELWRGRLDA